VSETILSIEGLRIEARSEHDLQSKTIVDDVALTLRQGEVLGLIGESGAGKTTIGLAALGYTRTGCVIARLPRRFGPARLWARWRSCCGTGPSL